MCDEGETADRADAVRTESQKMKSRAGETALDGSARSIIVLIVVGMLVGVLSGTFGIGGGTVIVPAGRVRNDAGNGGRHDRQHGRGGRVALR